jgi:hypothetical protein
MTPEEHQQAHIQLHHALDVLLACYLEENLGPSGKFKGLPSILDLLHWSHQKTMIPSACDRDLRGHVNYPRTKSDFAAERQLILLALACLALERPGDEPAIKDVARCYDAEGLPTFERLKRENELAVKSR